MLKPYRTPQTYFRRRDHNQRFEHENDNDVSFILKNAVQKEFDKFGEDFENNRILNFYDDSNESDIKSVKGAKL